MIQKIEDWILEHYGREVYTPGLDRMRAALQSLRPHLQKKKIVIIAGTNGKGETTHRLGQQFAQDRFCSWTSPHIQSITERFSSESGDISLPDLEALLKTSHEIVQREGFKLTYYEFLFFSFCRWAVDKNPDYLFLEVGLGGRLDAVNVLDAEVVLLTSISRDHQEFLGNRYDGILMEKLGVTRPQSTLISFLETRYLQERAESYCQKQKIHHVNLSASQRVPGHAFSHRNQLLAYAAYCHFKNKKMDADWTPCHSGLFSRGEIIRERNEWWLFGSHNVDGMRKLIQFLNSGVYNFKSSPFDLIVTSFSKRNEKDISVMLRMLKAAGQGKVIVTAFNHPKAASQEMLKALASQEGIEFVENIRDHVQGWTHQKILVAGSYYLLSELQPLFRSK